MFISSKIPLAPLLKRVSRSFYLSIQWLPREMRTSIAVGYLFARISDTLADTTSVPQAQRAACLQQFCAAVETGEIDSFIAEIATEFLPLQTNPDERELLGEPALRVAFAALVALSESDRTAVRHVLREITAGQQWDVTYFKSDELTSVTTPNELIRYTYQVAGCVGEFWTRVGLANLGTRFASDMAAEDLMEWGKHYGQALQLVNILRDMGEDRANCRCYLPEGHDDPEQVAAKWRVQAREWLADGETYVTNLRGFRVRFATVLPLLIGRETLDLLDQTSITLLLAPEKYGKIKVSRKIVRRCLWRGLRLALKRL